MSIQTTQYGRKKRGRTAYKSKASKIARVADNIYTLKYSFSQTGAGGFLHPQVWSNQSIFYEFHPGSILTNGATVDQIAFTNATPTRQADEAAANPLFTRTTDTINWIQFKLELDISYQYATWNHIKRDSEGQCIDTDIRIIILQIMEESTDKAANEFKLQDFYYANTVQDMTTISDRKEMKVREGQNVSTHQYKVLLDEIIPMHMDNEVSNYTLVPLAEHKTSSWTSFDVQVPPQIIGTSTYDVPIHTHQWGNNNRFYYKEGRMGKRVYREFQFKPGLEYMVTNFNSEINREKGRIIWGVYANGMVNDGNQGLQYLARHTPAINTCMTFKWKKAAA